MLNFTSGDVFATGAADYAYLPAKNPRVILEIEVEGVRTSAVVDTGCPFFICNPVEAKRAEVDKLENVGVEQLSTRKGLITGKLYRVTLSLIASRGQSVEVDATAFVPEADQWENEPSFLGLPNCLDRLRIAIDPSDQTFYFGKH